MPRRRSVGAEDLSYAPHAVDSIDHDRRGGSVIPATRLTGLLLALAALAALSAAAPFVFTRGPGPSHHTSVRGQDVVLYGYGPYRHMPADVALQGLAQDAVTLTIGVPAGPALVIIPMLLIGAVIAAILALRPHRGASLA